MCVSLLDFQMQHTLEGGEGVQGTQEVVTQVMFQSCQKCQSMDGSTFLPCLRMLHAHAVQCPNGFLCICGAKCI